MSTAGRCTEIRHTSQVPLPCAAEGQMAKSKRRTTAKGVTWGVSAKESNGIDLVGRPVSRSTVLIEKSVALTRERPTMQANRLGILNWTCRNREPPPLGPLGSDTPPLLRCTSSSIPETRSCKSISKSDNCRGSCAMLSHTEVGMINHLAQSPSTKVRAAPPT